MSFPEEIRQIVDAAVTQLVNDYGLNAERGYYLTENDATCKLFAMLMEKSEQNKIGVHSELRPFCSGDRESEIENCQVIKEDIGGRMSWDYQGQDAKNGSRVDICLIAQDRRYLDKAILKAKIDQIGPSLDRTRTDLKYWRILSYPVEAFRAAIEIKVKVHRNMTRIRKDIEKLAVLKQKNSQCLTYLVVLDRQADPKDIEKIRKIARKRDTEIKVHSPIKQ